MKDLNLLNINTSDPQEELVKKINTNFSQIASFGGGPQGKDGKIGGTGPIGPPAEKGNKGDTGIRGSKWYVSDNEPSTVGVLLNDYWLKTTPLGNSNQIYQFLLNSGTGLYVWTYTGNSITSTGLFKSLDLSTDPLYNINPPENLYSIVLSLGVPEYNSSLVISDNDYDAITDGNRIINPNGTKSKITVGTYGNSGSADKAILEFSRGDLENPLSLVENSKHPIIYFTNGGIVSTGNDLNDYSITLLNLNSNFIIDSANLTLDNSGGATAYIKSSKPIDIETSDEFIIKADSYELKSDLSSVEVSTNKPLAITSDSVEINSPAGSTAYITSPQILSIKTPEIHLDNPSGSEVYVVANKSIVIQSLNDYTGQTGGDITILTGDGNIGGNAGDMKLDSGIASYLFGGKRGSIYGLPNTSTGSLQGKSGFVIGGVYKDPTNSSLTVKNIAETTNDNLFTAIGQTGTFNINKYGEITNGLKFPATQVANSDPNTLDDYEEGVWTPTISGTIPGGVTIGSGGKYTKIGRMLYVSGYFSMSTASSSVTLTDNYIDIANLPGTPTITALSANLGVWNSTIASGSIKDRFFGANVKNGVIILSDLPTLLAYPTRIYFASPDGNPLSSFENLKTITFDLKIQI